MHVQVHYQGLDHSQWMEEFITSRVGKLSRYLSPASSIHVSLRKEKGVYQTNLSIHNHRDYSFHSDGENLYESFSGAIEKATRTMIENKRKIRDRFTRKVAA